MATFHFRVDARCSLVNGETQTLRGLRIPVCDATSRSQARTQLRSIVTEYIHDKGSDLTDAPVEDVALVRVREN